MIHVHSNGKSRLIVWDTKQRILAKKKKKKKKRKQKNKQTKKQTTKQNKTKNNKKQNKKNKTKKQQQKNKTKPKKREKKINNPPPLPRPPPPPTHTHTPTPQLYLDRKAGKIYSWICIYRISGYCFIWKHCIAIQEELPIGKKCMHFARYKFSFLTNNCIQRNCVLRLVNTPDWQCSYTVDSRYLEIQGTLLHTSRYPYFDISDLWNWGKQLIKQPHLTEWICNLTPKLEIYWKYCGNEEKLLQRAISLLFHNIVLPVGRSLC